MQLRLDQTDADYSGDWRERLQIAIGRTMDDFDIRSERQVLVLPEEGL